MWQISGGFLQAGGSAVQEIIRGERTREKSRSYVARAAALIAGALAA
jgi:hypothetical protein